MSGEFNINYKEVVQKVKRAFGFGFPAYVVVLHKSRGAQKEDEERYIENPEIAEEKEFSMRESLAYSAESLNLGIVKAEEPEKRRKKNEKRERVKLTLLRDKERNDIFLIRGDVKKYLKPYRIIDYYPEAAMALLLPAFVIYTLILMAMFGAFQLDMVGAVLISFLMAMMFFQGKYVYTEGGIYGMDAAWKGQVGGVDVYVPMDSDFLVFGEVGEKVIIHEGIKRLVAYFKPIMAANRLMTEEINKMADGLSKSFLMGMRMRKAYMDLGERYPAWIWAAIGVVIGIIIGVMISGGAAPPPNGGVPP